MSGGSFDYLCFVTDSAELAAKREALEEMAERLAELPWAKGAAVETLRLVSMLRRIDTQIAASQDLIEVWRAIEWWDSGDTGEEQTRELVAQYENLSVSMSP